MTLTPPNNNSKIVHASVKATPVVFKLNILIRISSPIGYEGDFVQRNVLMLISYNKIGRHGHRGKLIDNEHQIRYPFGNVSESCYGL